MKKFILYLTLFLMFCAIHFLIGTLWHAIVTRYNLPEYDLIRISVSAVITCFLYWKWEPSIKRKYNSLFTKKQ